MKNTIKSKILIIVLVALLFTGCGGLSIFGGSTSQEIPSAPEREYTQFEDIKKNVGVITDISQIAYTLGVNAHSKESETLLKSAKVLQTVTGLPTEPVIWSESAEVANLHEDILERESEFRRETAEWQSLIDSLSSEKGALKKQNSVLKGTVDKIKFWLIISIVALGALCFFCPTVGIALVKFLLGRAKKAGEVALTETASAFKNQLGQVVEAIEEHKRENPEEAKKLLDKLQKKTDSTTRKLIKELKD